MAALVRVALAMALGAAGLAWLTTPQASAEDYPTMVSVRILDPPQVAGAGWVQDDTVTIDQNGVLLGEPAVDGSGWFELQLSDQPVVGDAITVTGNDSSKSTTVIVTDLSVSWVDVPGGKVYGTGAPPGSPAGWGEAMVSVGSRAGPGANVSVPVSADGTWVAAVGTDAFDLMTGPGVNVTQVDGNGSYLSYGMAVPNPTIEIWDTHGVAASNWLPNSELTLSLDDPADGQPPFTWRVRTDDNGSFWDVPPSPWDVLEPGWVATGTGAVEQRETSTLTKTIVFPDPMPVPEMGTYTVSDTVGGVLTDASVGPGSLAQVNAECVGSTFPSRSALTDPSTGSFSFAFDQPPLDWGDGPPCTQPIVTVLYRLWDLDGDMYQQWWQRVTNPVVTVDPADWLGDGAELAVVASGYDLGVVQIAQCELVDGLPGACDQETTLTRNSSPGDGWPTGGAVVEETVIAKQVLDFGGRQVDCAAEPGACAVVVSEPYRADVVAWAPLTYEIPVVLEIGAPTKGTVSNITGSATLSGTITASDGRLVHLYGELRQRLGRTRVVVGWFDTWVEVYTGSPPTTQWTVVVAPQTGGAFGSGKAQLHVYAEISEAGEGWTEAVSIVKLTTSRR